MFTFTPVLLDLLCISTVVLSNSIQLLEPAIRCVDKDTFAINEYESYQIEWDGGVLPSLCGYIFEGRSVVHPEASFTICASILTYDVKDCNVTLKYTSGDVSKLHSCAGEPRKYCSDKEPLEVYISGPDYSTTSNVSIIILATRSSHQEESLPLMYPLIVVACVLGLVVFTALSIFIVIRVRSRRENTECTINGQTTMKDLHPGCQKQCPATDKRCDTDSDVKGGIPNPAFEII